MPHAHGPAPARWPGPPAHTAARVAATVQGARGPAPLREARRPDRTRGRRQQDAQARIQRRRSAAPWRRHPRHTRRGAVEPCPADRRRRGGVRVALRDRLARPRPPGRNGQPAPGPSARRTDRLLRRTRPRAGGRRRHGGGDAVLGGPEREAIQLAARQEGILLDPVYTGRAMAGLIDLVRRGEFGADETIVFWHTGGTPTLFAYSGELLASR